MIVPEFWAEGRRQERREGRQVTVRRFGWSDVSIDDAQRRADARVAEAMERILSGEKLPRREPKTPYNGAEGVPIREQIVSRHGSAVVTRNSYGARCLNTPDVFFADVDFAPPSESAGCVVGVVLALAALVAGWVFGSLRVGISMALAAGFVGSVVWNGLVRLSIRLRGGHEAIARRRVARFLAAHPSWTLRVYRTPAGLRLAALHRRFDPQEPEVAAAFAAFGTDRLYARMCLRQHCFRARLTAKPWRIGIADHVRPRRSTWPVKPELLPERERWIDGYEARAAQHAACRFEAELGSGQADPAVLETVDFHDAECRARSELPIA